MATAAHCEWQRKLLDENKFLIAFNGHQAVTHCPSRKDAQDTIKNDRRIWNSEFYEQISRDEFHNSKSGCFIVLLGLDHISITTNNPSETAWLTDNLDSSYPVVTYYKRTILFEGMTMSNINLFEQASRAKLSFASPKGQLTVEDLWDLPLESTSGKANLDDIAKSLHSQLKSEDNVSFVKKVAKVDAELQLKFDIVKHIIDVLVTEEKVASDAQIKARKKQQLLALIAQKENEQLSQTSLDELRAQVAAL